MGNRRMFSKIIISSAQFIKMPQSSQALYFHLAINADDDGVVEAFPVMRMISASEDDLKILIAKKFVTILNEDLVTFINDWLEHNSIRSDRKIDSKYKRLLVEVVGDVKLIEPRQRADRLKQEDLGRPRDNHGTAQDKIRQVNLIKNISSSEDERLTSFNKFWNIYPRRQAKKAAQTKWMAKKCHLKEVEILDDIDYRLKNYQPNGWLDRKSGLICDPVYIPLATTYLNQERWDDEEVIL